MTLPAPQAPVADIMEAVLLKGDLAKLTADERVRYYGEVCKSMGINPLTKPFEYITLNGKLQLYALRSCTDQLRKINGVSLEIVSREVADDILTIHVRARLPDGRTDEDLGAVAFPAGLKGENRANAELKAVTKAKRRATLSICGLGWLDETEIADIPARAKAEAAVANGVSVHHPDDYVGNGTRAKDTEPPGPQTWSRRDIADIAKCLSVSALHDWGAANSQKVNGYPPDIRAKVYGAFKARLTELEELEAVVDQVVHDSDDAEPRPARPEDFAEDTVQQIAGSISERAVDARNGRPRRWVIPEENGAIDGRPPRLQELNGPYDFPEMPAELERRK